MILGAPLAVVEQAVECDGPHRHVATIITDGWLATGWLADHGMTDLGTAARSTTVASTVTYTCLGDGGECHGHLEVDLARRGVWSTNKSAISVLVRYGTEVEQ